MSTKNALEPSELGKRVHAIMEAVFGGSYNWDRKKKVDWSNPYYIEIGWYGSLSTFDFNQLTPLLFHCHDAAIRLEIAPRTPRYLTLLFHQRQRDGSISQRHPSLSQAIAAHRPIFVDAPQKGGEGDA